MTEDEEIVNSILNESKHLLKSVFGVNLYPLSILASPLKGRKTPPASPMKSPMRSPMKVQKKERCDSEEFVQEFENFMVSE